jgi:hypothetical protein
MFRKGLAIVLPTLFVFGMHLSPAAAAECGHAVVVTLPGVTWTDIEREEPPNILSVTEEGAAGSVSVRTDSPTTSFASGFTTLGAGTRAEGGVGTGGQTGSGSGSDPLVPNVHAEGLDELRRLAQTSDYDPTPGALGSALEDPLIALGNADITGVGGDKIGEGRWTLLAAMDEDGVVDLAATGLNLLEADPSAPFEVKTDQQALGRAVDAALEIDCSAMFVDGGDLIRREQALDKGKSVPPIREPLLALDDLVGRIKGRLDPARDLLLLVSPTAPLEDPLLHLGVAVAWGQGFPSGGQLTSASTGGPGLVSLTDVAPTILRHAGVEAPASMVGRPWVSDGSDPEEVQERVAAAAELDREARFAHNTGPLITGVYSVLELLLVLAAAWLFRRQRRRGDPELTSRTKTLLQLSALAAISFPVVTYVVTPLPVEQLGLPTLALAIVGITAALAGLAFLLGKTPTRRLFVICAVTFVVVSLDVVLGSRLQLTGLWGNDPILGGRFTGLGNRGFTVLASSSLLLGTLALRSVRRSWVPVAVAALFVATVVIDGAPGLGSDVGGVIALVPALGISWMLLNRRSVDARAAVIAVAVAAIAVGAFLAFDLSRPPDRQTHLARLFEDFRGRGFAALTGAVGRKIRANAGVFTSSAASFLIPPIFGLYTWLVLRGGKTWAAVRRYEPVLQAGLVGSLLLAVLGFAVNDSGIIVVAIVLAMFAPAALLMLVERNGEGS